MFCGQVEQIQQWSVKHEHPTSIFESRTYCLIVPTKVALKHCNISASVGSKLDFLISENAAKMYAIALSSTASLM